MSCALCVATIAGGLLIAQQLGISDFVFALWVSGFNTALAYYLSTRIKVKLVSNKYVLSAILFFVTYLYFLKTGQVNSGVQNGMMAGVVLFVISQYVERSVYRTNRRKSLVPFQKVVIPLVLFVGATLLAAIKAF